MNLYYGGYGKYQFYTVAENEQQAIEQIKAKNNISHLPVTVKEINNIEGYKIIPKKVGEEVVRENKEESGTNNKNSERTRLS